MDKDAGLTLFELMVVIVVILIIAVTSLPILSNTLTVFRVKSSAETLATKLNQARQESVRRGLQTLVFIDQTNARIFVDLNHNGIPEGFANPDVQTGRAANEEYQLSTGITINVRTTNPSCFAEPDAYQRTITQFDPVPSPPTELGISDYGSANWKFIVFDSRGELQSDYRAAGISCITSNLNPVVSDPTGAVLLYCRPGTAGVTKYTVSLSLRGGISVLTYKRLPTS